MSREKEEFLVKNVKKRRKFFKEDVQIAEEEGK
jgi:hypothetical protein